MKSILFSNKNSSSNSSKKMPMNERLIENSESFVEKFDSSKNHIILENSTGKIVKNSMSSLLSQSSNSTPKKLVSNPVDSGKAFIKKASNIKNLNNQKYIFKKFSKTLSASFKTVKRHYPPIEPV